MPSAISMPAKTLDRGTRTRSGRQGRSEHLKTDRLIEGATVREFAEALGITPRDIVQLLIKRGVFATLNQPIGEKMAAEMATRFRLRPSFVPFEEMVIERSSKN